VLEGDGRSTEARPESGLRLPANERGPFFCPHNTNGDTDHAT
jgi:hypothetical protein